MLSKLFRFFLNLFPRPFLIRVSYFFSPFFAFFLRGNKYIDPIDEKSYRRFLPYGYGKQRKNALAPGTLSLERHRLLWLYLKNETQFFKAPLKVLHIAPEQCFLKLFRQQANLDYTTADLNSPIADVKADICNLPFKNNAFDVIFCNHVLEHIEDDKSAMRELFRVLKKDGFGIFQVPQDLNIEKTYEDFSITTKEGRKAHFGQYDHVRIYGKDYFDKLRNIGFKVNEVNYSKKLNKELVQKYSLTLNEILPVCTK